MSSRAPEILADLQTVARLRAEHAADPSMQSRVQAVKDYQHRRFGRTYADLLSSTRYADAARFFLDELYGPSDFTQRDDQFARVVPAMARLFPDNIVATVASLASLHALSEQLDHDMAGHLSATGIRAAEYRQAWQATGRRKDRMRQIDLIIQIGRALDRFTRSRLLRQTLHLMRRPARAAGLAQLQAFLEAGFDTFGAMNGAEDFLVIVEARERDLAQALFAADTPPADVAARASPLAQLP